MRKRRRHKKLIESGEQIDLPCRYCAALTPMSKGLIEWMVELFGMYLEKKGESPIKRDEVAVCPACVPRYEDEFCPRVITIDVPKPNLEGAFTPSPDESTDGFDEYESNQQAMGV